MSHDAGVALPGGHGFRLDSGGFCLTLVEGKLWLTRSGSQAGLSFSTLGPGGLDALGHLSDRFMGPIDGRQVVTLSGGHTWATFALTFDVDPARPGLFHWRFLVTPHALPPSRANLPELAFTAKPQVAVYTQQAPMAAGLAFLYEADLMDSTLFYFQDLTALSGYFAATRTSPIGNALPVPLPHLPSGIVGYRDGHLGLVLPGEGLAALPLGRPTVVSDGYLALTAGEPGSERAMALRFLEDLAAVYKRIARPDTELVDWQDLARLTLADLPDARNWVEIEGRHFLRAYVNDERSTAELISQLDVLTSLREYRLRYGDGGGGSELDARLSATLPHFYSHEAGAMLNVPLPEREKADSWYSVMALADLSRLAQGGDMQARRLLENSIERAIEVAHQYDYVYPIFFDAAGQLEVAQPDPPLHPPREYDVAGAYAYLMLDMYEHGGEGRYLEEAKNAVGALEGWGFDLAYELHVTAIAATACARLFRLTGDEGYLEQSYMPLAAFLRHCWLWECNYGYATGYRTFFGLSPMTYAKVITPKEQYEAWQYLAEYLRLVHGAVPPAVEMLVAEYCRHTLNTMRSACAPFLPAESIAANPGIARSVGRTAPELYIPLEDIRDGWQQSGQIAQELYGAGMALTFAAQAYVPLHPGLAVYSEYPLARWDAVTFTLSGTPDFEMQVALEGDVERVVDRKGKSMPLERGEGGLRFRARGGGRYRVV